MKLNRLQNVGGLSLCLFLREVCSVCLVTCPDTECKYYHVDGCTADVVAHSTDRFCITGRRKQEPEYKQMMRYGKPIDYKKCEKDVGD